MASGTFTVSNRFGKEQLKGRISSRGKTIRATWPGHTMRRHMPDEEAADQVVKGLQLLPLNHSALLRLGFEDN